MTRKAVTPHQVTEMLILREAGYTTLAISQKLNVSVRTVHRHLVANGIKKGKLKIELIQNVQTEMRNFISSDEAIRNEAAKLLIDDLAHLNHLRCIMLDASEHLKAATLKDAILVMRAAAAYSTALKNTSDMVRRVIGAEKEEEEENLPELIVRELTADEIAALMEQHDEPPNLAD